MRRNTKRTLSLLLAMLMAFAMLPFTAFADSVVAEPVQIINAGTGVVAGSMDDGDITVGANVTYYPSNNDVIGTMTADGKNWAIPLANNNGTALKDAKVTSCSSSDTSIVTVRVISGKCVAVSRRAGHARVTINGTYNGSAVTTVWIIRCHFVDVAKSGDFFYNPVYWALEAGITTGKEANKFDPYGPCTRGQVAMFLYRNAGSPALQASWKNPFKDVRPSDNFYKAVVWAYNRGITTGVDPTSTAFCPNNTCTREQIVTFIWRAAGSPQTNYKAGFNDVPSGKPYTMAVNWAVQRGITTGVSGTRFGVGAPCTRGMVVTFLYRW